MERTINNLLHPKEEKAKKLPGRKMSNFRFSKLDEDDLVDLGISTEPVVTFEDLLY